LGVLLLVDFMVSIPFEDFLHTFCNGFLLVFIQGLSVSLVSLSTQDYKDGQEECDDDDLG